MSGVKMTAMPHPDQFCHPHCHPATASATLSHIKPQPHAPRHLAVGHAHAAVELNVAEPAVLALVGVPTNPIFFFFFFNLWLLLLLLMLLLLLLMLL
jgi:hypothetical protein